MNKNVYLSIVILQTFLLANVVCAMEDTPTKEYSATLKDVAKALIVIEVVSLNGKYNHLSIQISPEAQILIQALVAAKDVAQQERQFTEETFSPFFVDQTHEQVTIKPHVPGTYTVQIPPNTPFVASNPQGTISIDPLLTPFNISQN